MATTMPTTTQNPQLMSSPFLCPFRLRRASVVLVVDHHGSGELVVPALLALVDGDPDESKHEDAGNDIGEVTADQLSRGRRPECLRIHYLGRYQHLPGGRAAVAPEDDHRQRREQPLHEQIEH